MDLVLFHSTHSTGMSRFLNSWRKQTHNKSSAKEAFTSAAVLGPAEEQACKSGTRKGSRFAQALLAAQAGGREGYEGKPLELTLLSASFPFFRKPFKHI